MSRTATQPSGPVYASRRELGMNREEFAAHLGYSKITSGVRAIARWESGKMPDVQNAQRLSRATGKPAALFLGVEDAEEEAHRVAVLAAERMLEALRGERALRGSRERSVA